jgi:hypothetical protein
MPASCHSRPHRGSCPRPASVTTMRAQAPQRREPGCGGRRGCFGRLRLGLACRLEFPCGSGAGPFRESAPAGVDGEATLDVPSRVRHGAGAGALTGTGSVGARVPGRRVRGPTGGRRPSAQRESATGRVDDRLASALEPHRWCPSGLLVPECAQSWQAPKVRHAILPLRQTACAAEDGPRPGRRCVPRPGAAGAGSSPGQGVRSRPAEQ